MKKHIDRKSKKIASAHEGLMSADVGPQSTKEELELSREELLELNEKLVAYNAELQGKVDDLSQAKNEMEDALQESEQRFRLKLESVLAPEGSIENLELGDIIDAGILQSLVNDFYELTHMPMSLIDVNGKVLVGVGWQKVCTEFHRVNPDTCRNCIASDVQLSAGVPPGEYKIYKCMNNMWDVATPVMLGDRQLGNLFMGQFFFEDEPLDLELFRAQAREYRFNEREYIAALEAVPRLSRKNLHASMTFFMKLADVLSKLSYSNLKLARALSERNSLMLSLNDSEQQMRLFIEHAPAALAMFDADMRYLSVSRRWLSDYGLEGRDLIGESHYDVFPEVTAEWREAHRRGLAGEVLRAEADRFERADGSVQWIRWEIRPWHDAAGKTGGIVIFSEDITKIKLAEQELRESNTRYHNLFENMLEGFAFCRMLLDDQGRPADFVYLDVNSPFGRLTGLKDVTGKKVTEVIPGIKESDPELFEIYGRVALTGQPEKIEIYVEALGIWFSISVYSPERGYFVVVFDNITERKRAEEALLERDNFISGILGSITDRLVVLDKNWRYRFANEEFLRFHGMSQPELLGRSVWELFPQFVGTEPYRQLHLAMADRVAVEYKVYHPSLGQWFSSRAYPITNGGVAVFSRDITEQQQAVEALQRSEEQFRTLADAIPQLCWMANADGWIFWYNQRWYEYTGTTAEQMEGWGWQSVHDPEVLPEVVERWQAAIVAGEPAEMYFPLRGNDGVYRTFLTRVQPLKDASGRVQRWLGTNTDISDLKRAEEELRKAKDDLELLVRERTADLQATMDNLSREMAERERAAELLRLSEERYRKVVADQTETICRFNADGTFTFVNDVFCRVFGKTREELLGSKWYPRVFPDDVPIIEERLRTMTPANPVVVIENRVYTDSGAILWLQAVNRGFFDENGQLIETQGVARDITERKLVEEELQQALQAAETVNDTIRRLVRTIAHEFRTPLGLLIGSTDILDRYWDRLTPEKRAEQLELIQNASYQISNLVNSVTVFNLSEIDRHGEPLKLQDIGDLCRSIAAEVETVWCAGHEFIVSIAANCGTAVIDDILFRRVLQNLLSNAFRYTLSNGTVSLDAHREKNMLVLAITDNGIGIPEDEQELIFDAFYRSRNVEGRRGLGLGLSIVREALSQMGGTITVTSSMGNGTTMRVEIPVVDPV